MIPYKKFIISLLFFSKDVKYISEKIKSFNYHVEDQWIIDIFNEIKAILPPAIVEMLDNKQIIKDQEWLKHYGIHELSDYFINKDKSEYYKWLEDCMWVINNKDIMILMNILLFNNETYESISDIIQFKFKKKLGVDMIGLYQKTFWDCSDMNAKDAFLYCVPFRNSSLIIRELASGETEVECAPADNKCDVPVTFHDVNYIKWRIGYKKIQPVSTKEFLEQVKTDSMYKYYETMHMKQCVESEDEDVNSTIYGNTATERNRYKNVEEVKAKLAKQWVDLYMKAEERVPTGVNENDEFFERMNQVSLDFLDNKESISLIDEHKDILEDIKGDM